ncbi:hypothetical protein Musp01_28250 [Muricauda sp. NBRC 101325]|nr:hypothetical protein Musp01_28250 [Muricauda sp. NBRC 101325]
MDRCGLSVINGNTIEGAQYDEILEWYINPNHMLRYIRGNAGYVVMADGKNLNVSRTKKQELLNQMGIS